MVFTNWALDETPRIIEFCLSGDVRLGYLLFVLRSQNLHMDGGSSQAIRARKNEQRRTWSSSYERETSASAAYGTSAIFMTIRRVERVVLGRQC